MSTEKLLRLIEVIKGSIAISKKLGLPCPAHVAFVSRLERQVNERC